MSPGTGLTEAGYSRPISHCFFTTYCGLMAALPNSLFGGSHDFSHGLERAGGVLRGSAGVGPISQRRRQRGRRQEARYYVGRRGSPIGGIGAARGGVAQGSAGAARGIKIAGGEARAVRRIPHFRVEERRR